MPLTLRFHHRLPTSRPAAEVWRAIAEAFTDSSRSRIWPDRLSHLSSAGLREGETVHVTYRLGPVQSRATYRVRDLVPGRSFRYEATEEHPLAGGAAVAVEPEGEGSVLIWNGAYRIKGLRSLPAAAFFKGYFEQTFFRELRRNLRRVS